MEQYQLMLRKLKDKAVEIGELQSQAKKTALEFKRVGTKLRKLNLEVTSKKDNLIRMLR